MIKENAIIGKKAMQSNLGIVAIGRNEGERFKKCLASFKRIKREYAFVYVDSGSTDDSVVAAREAGFDVVELDTTVPFTAARARNAGVDFLVKKLQKVEYIQFVDGDCQVAPNWLDNAINLLDKEPDVAAVCGRRSEINPQDSIYNALIDLEWNTPVGYNKACGGDAMYRASAFLSVEGFNGTVIAGEEPELCYRLRQEQWKIKRIDADMTFHDADLTHFSQWWKRAERYGHAAFEGASRYGKDSERYYVKEVKSIVFWGGVLPVSLLLSLFLPKSILMVLIALITIQWLKLCKFYSSSNTPEKLVKIRALLTIVCKLAEFKGGTRFLKNKFLNRNSQLIEYKSDTVQGGNK